MNPEMDNVADHEFMGEALREAARSLGSGEFPVGSVVVLETSSVMGAGLAALD
jgi:tRNA(Arg) A34 adenosine deaminase TadA